MRLLNAPATVTLSRDGAPKAIAWQDTRAARQQPRPRRIITIVDTWRYDGRWWEERPLGRDYYLVELEGGTQAELFREDNDWCITRITD